MPLPRKPAAATMLVPRHISDWLDGWGVPLRRRVEQAMAAGLAQHGQTVTVTPPSLRVGTDCSGAEAPIWSMRAMQLVHQHIFSSDIGRAPQLMIAANTKPTVMYKNLVKRRSCEVPAVDLYVAGFPCTPFSMLHNNSKLFKEKAARPLFKILQMLRRSDGPPAAVLENVTGILRVKEKVLKLLRNAGYVVVMLQMDPTHLGEPVARPRVYFLMVKAAFAIGPVAAMETVVRSVWSSLKAPSMTSLTLRCLPPQHPEVERVMRKRKAKFLVAQRHHFPGRKKAPRWPAKHKAFLASGGARKCSRRSGASTVQRSTCSADMLLLSNPRERSAWSIWSSSSSGSLTADLSQSVDRISGRVDGAAPTITPGSIIASAQLGRTIVPLEKLMLHAFPIHRMVIPKGVTDADLESLGGNTMHVMCVGVAIVMVLRMVNWAKARQGHNRTSDAPDRLTSQGQRSASFKSGPRTGARLVADTVKRKILKSSQPRAMKAQQRRMTQHGTKGLRSRWG